MIGVVVTKAWGAWPARGFTLVELVIALVLLAILAAVGGARFFDLQDYRTRAWAAQVLSALNYSRATAIAAHSARIRVTLSSTGLTLLQTTDCAQTTGIDVLAPGSETPLSAPAPSGAVLQVAGQTLPWTLCLDGLGRPRDISSATGVPLSTPTVLTLRSGSVSETVVLEAETGWAHR